MTYRIRPIHCCCLSDIVVRNWDREGEYAQLKNELDEIYQGQPTWLRIRVEDARTVTPIAYVDSDNHTGRGYVIVHETNPELLVFNVDEGIYQEVNVENVFYLGKDHARIPAFAIQYAVQGVKPPPFQYLEARNLRVFRRFHQSYMVEFRNSQYPRGNRFRRWNIPRGWMVTSVLVGIHG